MTRLKIKVLDPKQIIIKPKLLKLVVTETDNESEKYLFMFMRFCYFQRHIHLTNIPV